MKKPIDFYEWSKEQQEAWLIKEYQYLTIQINRNLKELGQVRGGNKIEKKEN